MAFGYTISHNKLGWINVGKVDEVSINLNCELVAIHLVQHWLFSEWMENEVNEMQSDQNRAESQTVENMKQIEKERW